MATTNVGQSSPRRRLRCLIADAEGVGRARLRQSVEPDSAVVVTAHAADGAAAVRAAARQRPDVVLMALDLPVLDGIQATARITAAAAESGAQVPSIIILTRPAAEPEAQAATALDCLRAGAHGVLSRPNDPDALVAAIRATIGGHVVLDPTVARWLARNSPARWRPPAALAGQDAGTLGRTLQSLSPRERQVLEALASGGTNRQLAVSLGIRETTAKTHVSRLLTKLGVQTRTQAVALALTLGNPTAGRTPVTASPLPPVRGRSTA
ncbi:MAG TPA: response regulator transcription factor [Kineosporiaceae bacterium]